MNHKKILIVGANGNIGKILLNKLNVLEHLNVTAMVRKEEQLRELQKNNINATLGDLHNSVENLKEIVKDFDTVIFTAGSGGSTGADKTLEIDLDGAVKIMEASEATGLKRFIIVSAAFADDRLFWDESNLRPYYIAKHYADRALKSSQLDYTIVRPVALTNDAAKNELTIAKSPLNLKDTIPREDVANFIISILDNEKTFKQVYEISSGSMNQDSWSEAL